MCHAEIRSFTNDGLTSTQQLFYVYMQRMKRIMTKLSPVFVRSFVLSPPPSLLSFSSPHFMSALFFYVPSILPCAFLQTILLSFLLIIVVSVVAIMVVVAIHDSILWFAVEKMWCYRCLN